jgi:hypothetical protein
MAVLYRECRGPGAGNSRRRRGRWAGDGLRRSIGSPPRRRRVHRYSGAGGGGWPCRGRRAHPTDVGARRRDDAGRIGRTSGLDAARTPGSSDGHRGSTPRGRRAHPTASGSPRRGCRAHRTDIGARRREDAGLKHRGRRLDDSPLSRGARRGQRRSGSDRAARPTARRRRRVRRRGQWCGRSRAGAPRRGRGRRRGSPPTARR